jgi:cell division protein FtsL
MRLALLIVGEIILLSASVLVFRSAWTLLDELFGKSNLWILLFIGIALTVIGLIIVNYEVKCELQNKKQEPAIARAKT